MAEAKKKAVEAKVKLYRADLGVVAQPKSQVANLIKNGEWSEPTAKQLKA